MPNYRRARTSGGSYFFTVVTYRRQPLLIHTESRRILRRMIREVRKRFPFTIDAWVLLPEHLHCIWTLPPVTAIFPQVGGSSKPTFPRRRAIYSGMSRG
jgi:putative transposase